MAYHTLVFPNYEDAQAAAQQLGFWDEDTDSLRITGASTRPDGTTFGWMIAEIGQNPIFPEATFDAEGNELTPAVQLNGYYVNIVGELPPEAAPFLAPGGYGCAGLLFAGSVPGPNE